MSILFDSWSCPSISPEDGSYEPWREFCGAAGRFDGIDFFVLPEDEREVFIGADSSDAGVERAYNRLRRTFQTHDHFLSRPILPGDGP